MVIISLTTTPPNFFHVAKSAADLLNNQTLTPDYVVINVPIEYNRDIFRVDKMYVDITSNNPNIIINRCHDVGPATKILGIFESDICESIKDKDYIIVIDDDIIYPNSMVEEYISTMEIIRTPEDIMLGVTGCNLEDGYTDHLEIDNAHLQSVNMVQGWSSYCISGKILRHLKDAISIHCFPNHTFYQDDIFISNFVKSKFDIKIIQTKQLWAHRFSNVGLIHNKNLCVNSSIGNSSLQMHNDKTINGGSGRDGNLKKNILSLAFLIRKNLMNFKISESRQRDILIHDYCVRVYDSIDEDMCIQLTKNIKHESIEESIAYLDGLEKSNTLTRFAFNRVGRDPNDEELVEFSLVQEKRGTATLVDSIKRALNITTYSRNMIKNVAVVFHVVIDGGHGCYTRVLESIKGIKNSEDCNIDFYTKTADYKGLKEQREILEDCGVSNIDVFNTDTHDGRLCTKWSKYLSSKINTDKYDLVLVFYEHLVTSNFIDSMNPNKIIIDSNDDVFLNEKVQNFITENKEFDLNSGRHAYRFKRFPQEKFNKNITRWFISEEEFLQRGNPCDVFIPHVITNKTEHIEFGNPIFIASDNIFNIQAIGKLDEFSDFEIDVYGKVCTKYVSDKSSRLTLNGYVEDLNDVYSKAPFSINPITMGTGSKIKIQESLGYGVPVVSMIDNGLNSDIVDGKNGYLCYTYEELMHRCRSLKEDLGKVVKMSNKAKKMQKNNIANRVTIEDFMHIYWGTNV